MVKTIKIIFVKPSNVGLLLEGENLTRYNNLHLQAVEAYKKASKILEKINGVQIQIEYTTIDVLTIPNEELKTPANKIILIKDDGTALLLQDEAFTRYQEHHFKGLELLGKKKTITGQTVKVTFL